MPCSSCRRRAREMTWQGAGLRERSEIIEPVVALQALPNCLYKRRACSRKAGSEERGGQLSCTVLRAKLGVRDAEQPQYY
jgi:hypothetical protein